MQAWYFLCHSVCENQATLFAELERLLFNVCSFSVQFQLSPMYVL